MNDQQNWMENAADDEAAKNARRNKLRNSGWNKNGEWDCPACGVGYGKNLNNVRPFGLVNQHVETHL